MRYVGVSTKMYFGYRRSIEWLRAVADESRARPLDERDVRVFVAPSFPVLESAARAFEGTGILLGAQNCSWGEGALTGEVAPGMLAELGVRLVELGHAERRRLFGETDEVIRCKAVAARSAGLTPLLCVGEMEKGTTADAVDSCARQALDGLAGDGDALVAYEPVWAIGAERPAAPGYVNEVIEGLRDRLSQWLGAAPAILYGGSAGPGLLADLFAADGLFLGRFAHDPARFGAVLDEALATAR